MEVLAITLTILSFATSPIVTKALQTGTRVPSFVYYHSPVLVVALCQTDKILGLLAFSGFMLTLALGATIYVWLTKMW